MSSLFLWAIATVATVSAQAPAPETVFRADSRLVVLNVSVFDRQGSLVRGLGRDAFTVFEDGRRQDVAVFRQEDVPVSLGLVVDNSASMAPKRDRVASAVLQLVRASNPQDEVFVLNFTDEAVIAQDFTGDVARLEAGLRQIGSSGQTAMRDALRLALEHLRAGARNDKKVLLVVTDGDDNSSVASQPHLVRAARRHDAIIYAVGLLGGEPPPEAGRVRQALEDLTLATGGRSWFPADLAGMQKISAEIAHEVRNQYVIGYAPSNQAADGSFRALRVEVNVPGAAVRTRSGYYAPRP